MSELAPTAGWQTIETAPTSTFILGFFPSLGDWISVAYKDGAGNWMTQNSDQGDMAHLSKRDWPTHWMPLPAPPAKQAKS